MFRARIILYFGILVIMGVLIWFAKYDIKRMLIKNRFSKSGIYAAFFIAIIASIGYRHFVGQIPLITNTVHTVQKGSLVEFRPAAHRRKTQSSKNLYDITIKDNASGESVFCKAINAPKLVKGMEVEVYLFEAVNLTDIVARIDGEPTEYYQKALPAGKLEKITVFLMVAIHTLILAVISSREYFRSGKRNPGQKWYLLGMVGLILYVAFTGSSMLNLCDNELMGEGIGDTFVIYFISYTFLVWENIKKDYQEENAIIVDNDEDSKTTDVKIKRKMPSIELVQMSCKDAEKYCNYKCKMIRKRNWETVEIMEYFYALVGFLGILFMEAPQSWYFLGTIVVLAILTPIVLMLFSKKKSRPIENASNTPCEYAFTSARIGKFIKCVCTDGRKIFWIMDYDEEVKVRDGDDIAVVYLSATKQLFTEKASTMQRIFKEE